MGWKWELSRRRLDTSKHAFRKDRDMPIHNRTPYKVCIHAQLSNVAPTSHVLLPQGHLDPLVRHLRDLLHHLLVLALRMLDGMDAGIV